MEQQSSSFEGHHETTDFFNALGGGILLSKKQQTIRSQILSNSNQIYQKSLQQKIAKYKKQNLLKVGQEPIILQQKNKIVNQPVKVAKKIPTIKSSFEDLKIIKPLIKVVSQLQYHHPTPIQSLTIPAILSGKDVLASSITGSGKTAAFLIPLLQRYYNCDKVNYSRVLILTPTRQLAMQCYQNFNSLNKYVRIDGCLVIGASSIQKQEAQLRNYPEIIIATPGRILDLLTNSQSFGLEYLEVLIFDEADKLLEMGFEAEIKQILTYLNQTMQTILFSATLGKDINKLATLTMRKPIRLSADPDNSTAQKLHQQIFKLAKDDQNYREAVLLTILTKLYTKKVIVFFKTKKQCHRIAILLGLLGLSACELHGNLSQTQRIQAFNKFKDGKYEYLMATDLAARGLDIKLVQTVINYELPTQLTRYIHRVGRTARAGNIGTSVTLCSDEQGLKLKKMMRSTGDKAYKLSLQQNSIKESQQLIEKLENDFNKIIEQQMEERDLRKAEMQLKKLENMTEHKQQIYNKPKKTWFLSEKQKKSIKQTSKLEAIGEQEMKKFQKVRKTKQIKKKINFLKNKVKKH